MIGCEECKKKVDAYMEGESNYKAKIGEVVLIGCKDHLHDIIQQVHEKKKSKVKSIWKLKQLI